MRELFTRAQVKIVEVAHSDARGPIVIRNGWGGMSQADQVMITANRDFGATDLTNISSETRDGDRLLLFRESDLGVPAARCVNRDYALERVGCVVRDRRVIFIDYAPEGAHWLHPLVVLPRTQAGAVVYGAWAEVEALILTADRTATKH